MTVRQTPTLRGVTSGRHPASASTPQYDPNLFLYGSEMARAAWRNAVAAQRNGERQAHALVLGDSIAAGASPITGSPYHNSWVGRLRSMVNARTGIDCGLGSFDFPVNTSGTGQPYWTFTGTGWSNLGSNGFNKMQYTPNSGCVATLNFSTTASTATVKVYFINYGANASPAALSVDGGTVVNVSRSGGTEAYYIGTVAVTSAGAHTLTITSSGWMYFGFVDVTETTTGGIKVSNVSLPGRSAVSANTSAASATNLSAAPYSIRTAAPDLTIIALGANDIPASPTDPALTEPQAYQRLIDAAAASGSVLLCAPSSDSNSSGQSADTARLNSYNQMLYSLADANPTVVSVLDIHRRVQGSTTGLFADAIGHETNRGAYEQAAAVFGVLSSGLHL